MNHESEIWNSESGVMNHESGSKCPEAPPLYPLSVRVPESLNDTLDNAIKQTRRAMGRKIPKEVLVTTALEAMMERVEVAGGWGAITSVTQLRQLLGLKEE